MQKCLLLYLKFMFMNECLKIFLFAAIYLRLGYTDHKVISQLNTIYWQSHNDNRWRISSENYFGDSKIAQMFSSYFFFVLFETNSASKIIWMTKSCEIDNYPLELLIMGLQTDEHFAHGLVYTIIMMFKLILSIIYYSSVHFVIPTKLSHTCQNKNWHSNLKKRASCYLSINWNLVELRFYFMIANAVVHVLGFTLHMIVSIVYNVPYIHVKNLLPSKKQAFKWKWI